MSTFYLLPPRPELGRRFAQFLSGLFPGLEFAGHAWPQLVESLEEAAGRHPDVYLVYREDLPPGEPMVRALVDGFGAAEGDDVVELVAGGDPSSLTVRRWRLRARTVLSA